MGVQDLPDECLALVLSLLQSKADRDAAALTCQRWRSLGALSRHSLYLRHWRFSKGQWSRLHLILLQALHSFPNILSMTIVGSLNDVLYFFPRVFRHKGFAQLTSFDLHISERLIDDNLLQCLADGCPSLTCLTLGSSSITDTGIRSLAHGCPLLRFLDLCRCHISDKGVDILLTKCVDLREFLLKNGDVKGWGFRHGKFLRTLELQHCNYESVAEALGLANSQGEAPLSFIGEYCKELEVLNLLRSEALNDAALEKIAEGCQNLETLDVSWCDNVTFDGWQALAFSCKKLEELVVVGCAGFDLECLLAIQEGCPNLRVLQISYDVAPESSIRQFQLARPVVEVVCHFEHFML